MNSPTRRVAFLVVSAGIASATAAPLIAQDSLALAGVHWREIGPYRGGRSVAATGNPSRPNEFWMGTTGGGVFKSINAGQSWAPVTDNYFGGTIGAIAVSASSPDVVYVGGGEYPIRGNVSHGDGVWKTTDGGKTWAFVGLAETRQIADIVVNPTNPDLVYVGALGHVWAPNPERGVFRSKDGGKTWEKILFRNDSTGVVDLVMDPHDPNVLYAGLWQAGRTPWLLSSGGKGSGMFKTTDGGDHWTEITRNPGLPDGIWGNIGITVSGGNSNRVWANIEADSGGVFRSDDGGATWQRTNNDRNLRQRAWYYTKIHADSKDTNVVYANNVSFMKSTDGGKTFRTVRGGMHHGDSHDFWVDPKDNQRMIESDDGGAEVSVDGGKTWSDEDFATAQFYHVIATNHFPYHICGAQQDNSTLCGPSRGSLDVSDWLEAGGGESGWIASRGDDPDIVYAGSYGNLLTRKDLRTGITVNVNPWPDNPMGHPAMDLKYRFQWTFPIIVSTHNPNVVYAGSNVVHKSVDGGRSWTVISPDLTYHDPATLGNSGGPLTKDQTSIEYYGTVFIIEESPVTANTIWTGSDDGKVYLTRNGGVKWTDVTPKDMAKYTRVSSIDASKFGECIAYVAANRFQLDDDKPYLWKTADCGAHWTRIDGGIAPSEFTRVVREDPAKRGLLVAGTERGAWYSMDDGAHWGSLRLNLPIVPVHDLVFKEGDIVIATHGRSFYIMDDVTTLEQMSDAIEASNAHLFRPRDQYRLATGGGFGGGGGRGGGAPAQVTPENAPIHPTGQNPPAGVVVQYWLGAANDTVALDFLDATGKLIRGYSSKPDSAAQPGAAAGRRLCRARAGAARAESARREHLRLEHALSRRDELPGNDSLGGRRDGTTRAARHVQDSAQRERQADCDGNVQGAARSAHQGDARRLAGAVATRARGSRSLLRGERRGQGNPPHQVRAGGSREEAGGGPAPAIHDPLDAVRDRAVGGRGLALPDQEPQRPGPAQLPDPAQQPHRRVARRHPKLRRAAHAAELRRRQAADGRAQQGSHEVALDDWCGPAADQRDAPRGGTQGDRIEGAGRLVVRLSQRAATINEQAIMNRNDGFHD